MTSRAQDVAHLGPSELGTKQYWDNVYSRELTNYKDDNEDEGTVWFDENSAEDTVVRLLNRFAKERILHKDGSQASRILDLGTGNGHMLFALREMDEDDDEESWKGDMIGIDYSAASIDLAKQIAVQREVVPAIRFETWDLLKDTPEAWVQDGFDLVLDKGTFDAISLMTQQNEHSCDVYCRQVAPLIKPGGFLVITSCNWTRSELLAWIARSAKDTALQYYEEASYPSFTFGGQTGQSIVTVVFRREST